MAWRGHYIDPTGLYYLGTRYYAPDSGTFLSADSLGHRATPDLYQAFNGNPISYFDPDGRLATQAAKNTGTLLDMAFNQSPDFVTSLKTVAGIPVSLIDGNLFQSYDGTALNGFGPVSRTISVNGIDTPRFYMNLMRNNVATQMGLSSSQVYAFPNNSMGKIFDFLRAGAQGLGAIDISAVMLAQTVNLAGKDNSFGPINVIAHSNGSAVFGAATPYISSSTLSRIDYQGFGGQWNISQSQYRVHSSENTKNPEDPVPGLSPFNAFQSYRIVPSQVTSSLLAPHNFENNYLKYVAPSASF
jgi:RHS repeat-associated protein